MIRRPPRSTPSRSSAASDVYKRQVCENRDTKGLYKKARLGEIKEFTGISSPYEAPRNPEIIVDTGSLDLNDSVEKIIKYLKKENFLNKA